MALTGLPALYRLRRPFASVYLAAPSALEQAARTLSLRWRSARRELEQAGARQRQLDALEGAVEGAHAGGDIVAAIADITGTVRRWHLPEGVTRDVTRFGALPHVVPLLAAGQALPPHVIVLTDRIGADIVVAGGVEVEEARQVEGDVLHITRSAPGGWSQRRFQQRAENRWEENARQVAEHLTALVDEQDPMLVLVTGDVRAVQFLRTSLPSRVLRRLEELEGGGRADERASGGVPAAVQAEVSRRVNQAIDRQTREIVQAFRRECGQRDRAVEGVEGVMAALRRAQASTLLLQPDRVTGRAWIGASAVQLGTGKQVVEASGAEDAVAVDAIDALAAAALLTGADLRLIDCEEELDGGVAALLRYPSV